MSYKIIDPVIVIGEDQIPLRKVNLTYEDHTTEILKKVTNRVFRLKCKIDGFPRKVKSKKQRIQKKYDRRVARFWAQYGIQS